MHLAKQENAETVLLTGSEWHLTPRGNWTAAVNLSHPINQQTGLPKLDSCKLTIVVQREYLAYSVKGLGTRRHTRPPQYMPTHSAAPLARRAL